MYRASTTAGSAPFIISPRAKLPGSSTLNEKVLTSLNGSTGILVTVWNGMTVSLPSAYMRFRKWNRKFVLCNLQIKRCIQSDDLIAEEMYEPALFCGVLWIVKERQKPRS
jgi:hypothetical protein